MTTPHNLVRGPLAALVKDAVCWAPDLEQALHRDLELIVSRVQTRGLRIVLSTLPKYGKMIDNGLSRQILGWDCDVLAEFGVPRWDTFENYLFGSLISKVFESFPQRNFQMKLPGDTGPASVPMILREDADENAVFFLRQFCFFFKKLIIDCPADHVRETYKSFLEVDRGLRDPILPWNQGSPILFSNAVDNFRHSKLASFVEEVHHVESLSGSSKPSSTLLKCMGNLEKVRDVLLSDFPAIDYRDLHPRHGPGAVSDAKSGSDKYRFPFWPVSADHLLPEDYFAFSSEEWASEGQSVLSSEIPYGRLLAVPKTWDKPRLITSEPTALQFLQQGLLRWIRHNLPSPLRRCIDFFSQEPSRELALSSSRDGSLATVDLSAASDRLSLRTVEMVFAKTPLLPYLYAVRTPCVYDCTQKSSPRGDITYLKKYAGQGSAVTFPLQSIVYSMCCIAAVLSYENKVVSRRNITAVAKRVRVFGDDIIIPGPALSHLAVILEFLQLKINGDKTHWEGNFRESCGMDAFKGQDVTPVYIRALRLENKPASLTSWVDVCNNAHSAGLFHLSNWMEEQIPWKTRCLIPVNREMLGCLTLRTFSNGLHSSGRKSRYNSDLQVTESLGLCLETKRRQEQRGGYRGLLQFFTEFSGSGDQLDHLSNKKSWRAGYTIETFFNLRKVWVSRG